MDTRAEVFYFIGSRLHELGDLVPALICKIGTALPQLVRQICTHQFPPPLEN